MQVLPSRPTPELVQAAFAAAKDALPADDTGGKAAVRARHVAFDALALLYPNISPVRIGFHLSYGKPGAAAATVDSAKRTRWWSDTFVDHVIGTLVADQYGERAL